MVSPVQPDLSRAQIEKPFRIELRRENETPSGYFTPAASVLISPTLRISGLLASLRPDDVTSLVYLLTFVHPNGYISPSIHELARWMCMPVWKTRLRMRRLIDLRFHGQPVVLIVTRDSGMAGYTLAPHLVDIAEPVAPPAESEPQPQLPSSREAVIAHSRETYTRPRAEVEAEIAERMEWEPSVAVSQELALPSSTEQRVRAVRQRLYGLGFRKGDIDSLLDAYSLDAIEQQLDWLPGRHPKQPARLLRAALAGDYRRPERMVRSSKPVETVAESASATDDSPEQA